MYVCVFVYQMPQLNVFINSQEVCAKLICFNFGFAFKFLFFFNRKYKKKIRKN